MLLACFTISLGVMLTTAVIIFLSTVANLTPMSLMMKQQPSSAAINGYLSWGCFSKGFFSTPFGKFLASKISKLPLARFKFKTTKSKPRAMQSSSLEMIPSTMSFFSRLTQCHSTSKGAQQWAMLLSCAHSRTKLITSLVGQAIFSHFDIAFVIMLCCTFISSTLIITCQQFLPGFFTSKFSFSVRFALHWVVKSIEDTHWGYFMIQ